MILEKKTQKNNEVPISVKAITMVVIPINLQVFLILIIDTQTVDIDFRHENCPRMINIHNIFMDNLIAVIWLKS